MNILLIIFAIAFGIALLLVLGSSLFVAASAFQSVRRRYRAESPMQSSSGEVDGTKDAAQGSADGTHHNRVLEMLKKLPAGSEPYKCGNCGATVDSTAEISRNGDIKCNYCHSRTNLFGISGSNGS